jgi:hypothetical protein
MSVYLTLDHFLHALHGNITSLIMITLYLVLYFPFSLIRFSEIKFRDNRDPLTNIQIVGYEFQSKPSLSNAGVWSQIINNS